MVNPNNGGHWLEIASILRFLTASKFTFSKLYTVTLYQLTSSKVTFIKASPGDATAASAWRFTYPSPYTCTNVFCIFWWM